MCRLIATPPGFSENKTIEILKDMEGLNIDGFGLCYVENGNFVVKKWIESFSELLEKKIPIFEHLKKHNSWTIFHQRKASIGDKSLKNVHPFVSGDYAIIQNGTWTDHKIARLALGKNIKWESDTDTETALHCIINSGIKKFSETIDWGGVFLLLSKKDGALFVIKTNSISDLEIQKLDSGKFALCSRFPIGQPYVAAESGYYKFNPDGTLAHFTKKENKWAAYHVSDYNLD